MKFGLSIVTPSHGRLPDFDSAETRESFTFDCIKCVSDITLNFDNLISKYLRWEEEIDTIALEQVKRYFEFNVVGKTPDGGWPSVVDNRCPNCETNYLVYAGVDEYYNSLFKVTLQGIVEIIDE